MSRRRAFPFASVVLGALASVVLTSCTAIGFTLGALTDMSDGKQTVGGFANVRTGTDVTMWLRDGRKLHGRFLGCRDSLSSTALPVPPSSELGHLVPFRAVIVLGNESVAQQVPIDLVERISVPVHRGKWIGTAVGICADAFLVFIAWITAGAAAAAY